MSNLVVLRGPKGVRLVQCGKPYSLQSGEHVIGSASVRLEDFTPSAVGAGDLVAAVLASVGFTKWWNARFKGCKCKKRQAALNYLKVQGPEWLKKWTKENAGS